MTLKRPAAKITHKNAHLITLSDKRVEQCYKGLTRIVLNFNFEFKVLTNRNKRSEIL